VQRRSTDFTRATVTVTTNGTNVPLMVVYPILPKDTEDFGTSTFTWEIESDTLIAGNTYTVTIAGAVSGGVTVPRWSYDVTVFDTGAYEAAAVAQFGDVVDRMFADFLDRPPLTRERQMWSAQIKASRNRTLLAEELANSPEWTGAVIDRMYVDTLGRAGDSTGREYWISRLRTNATVRQVAASFYSSPEYFSRYGRGDSRTWIADLYVKLLGRAPDAVGLAYWETTLTRTNRQQVAAGLYQSVESRNARVTALYRSLLGRDPEPTGLAAWSQKLVTSDDMTLAVELATSDEYGRRR
jgi:hypothetical protein